MNITKPLINLIVKVNLQFSFFVFSAIKEALNETVETAGVTENISAAELHSYKIEQFLQKFKTITNADEWQMFQVSAATANHNLASLTDEGNI